VNKKALFHPTVKCGQFAFLVVLTNWHYGRSYKVKDMAYAWQIDGTLFTSFIALVGLSISARRSGVTRNNSPILCGISNACSGS
jgi:hypothetical protein